jgi:hypothetical protein
MEGLAVLVEALQRGSEAVWEPPDRPRLGRVPADLRDALQADREAVRRVLTRAAAFRAHLAGPGPAPVLVLPDRPAGAGGCISCGLPAATIRCALCSLACWIALGRTPPPNVLGAP